MQLRRIFGAFSLAAALVGQTATQPLQVVAIRFWSLAGVTRVAIETNGDFQYKSDRISNPDRLFFDLIGATPHLGAKGIIVKQVGDKLLRRVRIAQNVPGGTRVVLDLEGDVDYTASQLGNPDRLIIELRRSTGTAPAPTAPVPALVSAVEPPPSNFSAIAANTRPVAVIPQGAKLALVPPRPPPSKVIDFPRAARSAPLDAPVPIPVTPAPSNASSAPFSPGSALSNPSSALSNPSSALSTPPVAPTSVANHSLANPARRTATDGTRSLTRALGLKINRVVIDPGHGGHDQGTSGSKGLLEKDLVLDVSLRLGKLIEERMGSEVIYTRSDDTFIPLQERTAFANRHKADLFLSIHANSSPVPRVTGIETYYLNFTNSADAMDVATRENASADKSVYELQDLIQTIAKHDKTEESREFAASIQSALQALEIRNSPTAKDRGIRKAPFVVLIGAQMPSVLAEIGFLSNPREESLLAKPEFRQKMAEALYRGLSKYTQTLSHYDLPKTASTTAPLSSASSSPSRSAPARTVGFDK
jgi:N-acetylmuramoyl-L-alanine amidase